MFVNPAYYAAETKINLTLPYALLPGSTKSASDSWKMLESFPTQQLSIAISGRSTLELSGAVAPPYFSLAPPV